MAATVSMSSAMRRTLECSVCLKMYNLEENLPQSLGCGHSFCMACIDTLLSQSSSIPCPKCRQTGSIDNIITNYGITDLLDVLCEECTIHDRAANCYHCSLTLCLICLDKHSASYHTELTTKLDGFDDLIQSAKGVLSDSKLLSTVTQKADKSIMEMREIVQKWRNALDKLEMDFNDKITRLQETDIQECTSWTEELDQEIHKAQEFHTKSRDILGSEYAKDCTMDAMSNIDDDYQKIFGNLHKLQKAPPVITDYHFEGASGAYHLNIGQIIVSGPQGRPTLYKGPSGQTADVYRTARFKCMTGRQGSGPEEFNKPAFVACMDDRMIISDSYNHAIKIYDYNLHLMHVQGKLGDGENEFNKPKGLAVIDNQQIVVGDALNHRIKIFTKYCDQIKIFDQKGSLDEQYYVPAGLCVGDNVMYICDEKNKRMKVMNKDCTSICNIGDKIQGLFRDIPIDVKYHKGKLLVSERGYPRLKVYSTTGEYITSYPNSVSDLPKISGTVQPTGIAVDQNDNIIFADYAGRLVVLDEGGKFVCTIGEYGKEPGQLKTPYGVAITPHGDIVVCEHKHHRIQLFELQ